MPSIIVEVSPEVAAWLESLKAEANASNKAMGYELSATVEDEARFQLEIAYTQACAAGSISTAILNEEIPF
nr:hypothetical protein [uncultured Shinella sp.]